MFSDFDEQLLILFLKADKTTMKAWQLLDMEPLPTWTTSKLALMGDAAHPCLPCKPPSTPNPPPPPPISAPAPR